MGEGRVVRDVAAALAAEPDIFVRATDGALAVVHSAPDGVGVSELTGPLLAVWAADAPRLLTPVGAPAPLPGRIAQALLADRDRRGFRRLAGIVERPAVAPDG